MAELVDITLVQVNVDTLAKRLFTVKAPKGLTGRTLKRKSQFLPLSLYLIEDLEEITNADLDEYEDDGEDYWYLLAASLTDALMFDPIKELTFRVDPRAAKTFNSTDKKFEMEHFIQTCMGFPEGDEGVSLKDIARGNTKGWAKGIPALRLELLRRTQALSLKMLREIELLEQSQSR